MQNDGTPLFQKFLAMARKKLTRPKMRYEYLIDLVEFLQPKSIIEIGVAEGVNAKKMLEKCSGSTLYTGYDVFDFSDKAFHEMVGNGKRVKSKDEIYSDLISLTPNVTLHQGMTKDTLWPTGDKADLVWLDGDHRIEAIRQDFLAVQESKVVVFDDFYITDQGNWSKQEYGCNKLVEELGEIVITPPTKKFADIRLAIWSQDHSTIKAIDALINR